MRGGGRLFWFVFLKKDPNNTKLQALRKTTLCQGPTGVRRAAVTARRDEGDGERAGALALAGPPEPAPFLPLPSPDPPPRDAPAGGFWVAEGLRERSARRERGGAGRALPGSAVRGAGPVGAFLGSRCERRPGPGASGLGGL